ncbi:MAG: DUF2065 domain-containing protein [Gammaproteobacteria bacterium]|nr:DUF2065 domain-containing protein [Gammaproteobacteria bacterium]
MTFDWQVLLSAIGIVFVVEGLFPFAMPRIWRRWLAHLSSLPDHKLRVLGVVSLVFGTSIIVLLHLGLLT